MKMCNLKWNSDAEMCAALLLTIREGLENELSWVREDDAKERMVVW
jgi:hypothetical protein